MQKKVMIYLIIGLLMICGCKAHNENSNNIVSAVQVSKLNELADDFLQEDFDYLWQFQFNHDNYIVKKIQIDYYKDGKKVHNFLNYMRDVDNKENPSIQYFYVGFNFNQDEQTISSSEYLYGPKGNKFAQDYSISLKSSHYSKSFDLTKLGIINSLEDSQPNQPNYLKGIVFDSDVPEKKDNISNLIKRGKEIIVIEFE